MSHGEKDDDVPWEKIKNDFYFYLQNHKKTEIKVIKGLKHFMNKESLHLMKHFLKKN